MTVVSIMLICTVFICIEAWTFISSTWFLKQAWYLLTPRHIFASVHLGGQGQGRMAGASTSVYEFNSVVRIHHVYKTVWIPLIDEMLQVHGMRRQQHAQQIATL